MTGLAHKFLRTLSAGQAVGAYSIVKRLAAGGMAELFLAVKQGPEGFEKPVVIKRILPEYAQEAEFVAMFLDEARLLASLSHPNIVAVDELGEQDGEYFFAMEYVNGLNLRELRDLCRVVKVALPLEHVLTILCGAAAGLHYAHERKDEDGRSLDIVHRDVSPQNVLVSFDGAVKLVDFGVARSSEARAHTEAGQIKGKIGYMSPEQCRNRPLDRRSDVFSLGALLYEMTTGTRLYVGENDFVVLEKTAHGRFDPPSRVIAKYPRELELIVLRALALSPEDRYPNCRALSRDLEAFAKKCGMVLSNAGLSEFVRGLCQLEKPKQAETEILNFQDMEALPTIATVLEGLEESAVAEAPTRPPTRRPPRRPSHRPALAPVPTPAPARAPAPFRASPATAAPVPAAGVISGWLLVFALALLFAYVWYH
jgi:serine/threonine-protein kinase